MVGMENQGETARSGNGRRVTMDARTTDMAARTTNTRSVTGGLSVDPSLLEAIGTAGAAGVGGAIGVTAVRQTGATVRTWLKERGATKRAEIAAQQGQPPAKDG